jgi:hypothetical protein
MKYTKSFVFGALSLVLLGGGCFSGPENIAVEIDVPTRASVGETFMITADITNTDGEAHILDSIDIGDEYLEGVVILGTDPAYSQTFHVPIDNTMSHTLLQTIEAGETLSVTFEAEALVAGDYSGAFDVCIDSGGNCLFYSIRTLVE